MPGAEKKDYGYLEGLKGSDYYHKCFEYSKSYEVRHILKVFKHVY